MSETGATALLSLATVIALVLAAVPAGTGWAQEAPAPTAQGLPFIGGRGPTILLFPANVEAAGAPADLSRWATTAVQTAVGGLPGVICLDFSRSSPIARRALREGRIRTVDLEQSVTDPRVGIQIGRAMEADMVLLATVQSYKVTTSPASAEVVVAGQVYDVKTNYDDQSQEAKAEPTVFRAFGVVGRSKLWSAGTDEGVMARQALRDAAWRASQVINGKPAEEVGAAPAEKKSNKSWRWFLLAAAVVGLAAAAHNSEAPHVVLPTPPEFMPRNAVATPLTGGQNAIQITWLAPTKVLTDPTTAAAFLGYQLQRQTAAKGSSVISAPVTIANYTTLGRTATIFTDFGNGGLPTNVTYYYRIRGVYSISPFVTDFVQATGVGLP
jgi:hypothetical protein